MRRQTNEEKLLAMKEELHDVRDVLNGLARRLQVLWDERQQQWTRPLPPIDLKPMDCFGEERE